MTLTDYIIYTVWCLFPIFFILVALWGFLEKFSDKSSRDDISDYLKQALFLTICVAVSVFIDRKAIASIAEIVPLEIPILYYRIILFPFVMFILGKLTGGSIKIEVEKNPLLKYNQKSKKR